MAYNYEEMKPKLFTEENQKLFLEVRDRVFELLSEAGAIKLGAIMDEQIGGTWEMIACVDRLVELGEIKEVIYTVHRDGSHPCVSVNASDCFAQDRIFVEGEA